MSSYTTKKTPASTGWFTHDRFGLFIHWGLYSVIGRHEWIKHIEKIPNDKYDSYMKYFEADLYDPRDWARRAKRAGMKYAVLTAKHHEGFCMFDSKYTDYKCTNTPCGRDLVKEYVEAFREEGLKVGIYYSLIDWHHPDFTIDQNHPEIIRDDAEEINKSRDMKRYARYMRDQLTELMTNYGKIDILWFDFAYDAYPEWPDYKPWMKGKRKDDYESEKLIDTVRALQPDIIINDRADIEQDITTPEQKQPMDWVRDKETGERVVWEACHTLSTSHAGTAAWGYNRDALVGKSDEMLLNLLINTVSCGGNLILNVGATARGDLGFLAEKSLGVYEKWMKYNSRSIYGCTMAEPEWKAPRGCRLTQSEDGKRLYIHIIEYPYAYLDLAVIGDRIEYARFLHDGSEVQFSTSPSRGLHAGLADEWKEDTVTFKLPITKPCFTVPVIEVFLKD